MDNQNDLTIANNVHLQIILDRVQQIEALLMVIAGEFARPNTTMHIRFGEKAIEYDRADRKRLRELFNSIKQTHASS